MITLLALGVPGVDVLRGPLGLPAAGPGTLGLRPVPRCESEVIALIDLVADLLETGRPVIVLHCDRDGERVRPLVRLIRRALADTRIAAVGTTLPPLAAGVVAERLATLAEHGLIDAGNAFTALPGLESELGVGAWLSSVLRLRRPAPSAGQRLTSLLPVAGFVAPLQPAGPVFRAGPDPTRLLGDPTDPPAIMLLAGHDPLPGWVETHVVNGPTDALLLRVPPSPAATDWWGSPRVVELVGIGSLTLMTHLAGDPGTGRAAHDCPWCALPLGAPTCPFCGLNEARTGHQDRTAALAGRPTRPRAAATGRARART